MKKKLKKNLNLVLIFTFILSGLLLASPKGLAVNPVMPQPAPAPVQAIPANQVPPPSSGMQPSTIPQKNAYALTHLNKQDDFKAGVLKFLMAMVGVLVSVLVIFLVLKFYKKVMLKNNLNLGNIDYDKTLESPKDLKGAINIFLDKTEE